MEISYQGGAKWLQVNGSTRLKRLRITFAQFVVKKEQIKQWISIIHFQFVEMGGILKKIVLLGIKHLAIEITIKNMGLRFQINMGIQ